MARLRSKAAACAAAGLLALGAAEVLLRLFVPGLSISRFDQRRALLIETGNEAYGKALAPSDTVFWKFKPGVVLEEGASVYFPGRISNALGLRNEELSRKKPPGVFRILALGDSCTFGVGVPQPDCYPRQLERILNDRAAREAAGAPPVRFQVLNAGVPGYTSFQGLRDFQERGASLHPDLVLACFGWNDAVVWDNRTDRFISQYLAGDRAAGLEGLLSRSALYRAARKALYSLEVALRFGPRTPRVPVEAYVENCRSLVHEARAGGMGILFLRWPMRSQAAADVPVLTPHQQALARFCAAEGARLVDLLPFIRERGGPSLYIDEGHMNARGYGLVARRVADALAGWGLLPPGKR